jgi:hypothetical protein
MRVREEARTGERESEPNDLDRPGVVTDGRGSGLKGFPPASYHRE